MSSNLELKRICQHCGKSFIAKKISTKFCSLECGQRNYKVRERINMINASNAAVKASFNSMEAIQSYTIPPIEKHFISIKILALTIGVSERTLFRLLKDNKFPRLKIGRRLLFHRESVINYISNKYGIYFFKILLTNRIEYLHIHSLAIWTAIIHPPFIICQTDNYCHQLPNNVLHCSYFPPILPIFVPFVIIDF